VEVLFEWEKKHCSQHPLFELVGDEEVAGDVAAQLALTSSEESRKVDREGGKKFICVFRRLAGVQ
jgi:tRNA (guanine-N7-)-methyltransferase